jgi:predicted RNA-binding protein with PUA-like domain
MGVSPWDGVRNHEAKNLMKSRMKLGHKVNFRVDSVVP